MSAEQRYSIFIQKSIGGVYIFFNFYISKTGVSVLSGWGGIKIRKVDKNICENSCSLVVKKEFASQNEG